MRYLSAAHGVALSPVLTTSGYMGMYVLHSFSDVNLVRFNEGGLTTCRLAVGLLVVVNSLNRGR